MHDFRTAAEARLSERAERDADAGGIEKTGKEEHDLRGLRGDPGDPVILSGRQVNGIRMGQDSGSSRIMEGSEAEVAPEIEGYDVGETKSSDYQTRTVYVKREDEKSNCQVLIKVIMISIDDYQSTSVGGLGSWVTDRMASYERCKGVTKEVANFTYHGREWRLIGRWVAKEALISELDCKDETIVYVAFPKDCERERRNRSMDEGEHESR